MAKALNRNKVVCGVGRRYGDRTYGTINQSRIYRFADKMAWMHDSFIKSPFLTLPRRPGVFARAADGVRGNNDSQCYRWTGFGSNIRVRHTEACRTVHRWLLLLLLTFQQKRASLVRWMNVSRPPIDQITLVAGANVFNCEITQASFRLCLSWSPTAPAISTQQRLIPIYANYRI